MKAIPTIIIILGIIFTLFAPYAFTQCSSFIYFGRPNEIGDTIGGITAPIIGIMGALLLYLTIKKEGDKDDAEIRNIRNAITDDLKLIYKLLNDLEEELVQLPRSDAYNKIFNTRVYYTLNNNLFTSLDRLKIITAFGVEKYKILNVIYSSIKHFENNTLKHYLSRIESIADKDKLKLELINSIKDVENSIGIRGLIKDNFL